MGMSLDMYFDQEFNRQPPGIATEPHWPGITMLLHPLSHLILAATPGSS